jgi:heptosyltransferase-3
MRAARVSLSTIPWIEVKGPRDALFLCPGAQGPLRMWPVERFIALGQQWDGPVQVFGGAGEAALVQTVVTGIGEWAHAVVEDGYEQAGAALGNCRVAVGGDNAFMTLFAAAEIPIVGLFGPTESRHMSGPFAFVPNRVRDGTSAL